MVAWQCWIFFAVCSTWGGIHKHSLYMTTPCLWLQTFPSKVNTVQAPGQSSAIVCTPDKTCLFRPVQGLRAAPETVTQVLFQWRKQMETSTTFLLFPSLGAELYSIPHVFFFIRTAGSLKTNVFFQFPASLFTFLKSWNLRERKIYHSQKHWRL